MKFVLYHDPSKKNLSIPAAALKLSGLGDAEMPVLEAGAGSIILTKEEMTAKEMIATIDRLSELAADLIVKLAMACDAREDGARECGPQPLSRECIECGGWRDGCDSGVSIPLCALRDAGIDPDAEVDIYSENGRVIITAAEDEEYLPDDIPPALRNVLEASGICPDCLKELVDSGETIHV